MKIEDRIEIANQVAGVLLASGRMGAKANVWNKGEHVRIYCEGRGHIAIDQQGRIDVSAEGTTCREVLRKAGYTVHSHGYVHEPIA